MPEHEYQVRLGTIIRVLRNTLPHFMECGLVDRTDSSSSQALFHVLRNGTMKRSVQSNHVYHRDVVFTFRPGQMPASFESLSRTASALNDAEKLKDVWKPSISFHGRSTYLLAASVFRHTIHACFTDTQILMEHMSFQRKPRTISEPSAQGSRDELIMRIRFDGRNRFTQTQQTYTIISRYCFDRRTGTISEHIIDKMMPLPGERVLRSMSGLSSRLA